jgi:hypothetical protein
MLVRHYGLYMSNRRYTVRFSCVESGVMQAPEQASIAALEELLLAVRDMNSTVESLQSKTQELSEKLRLVEQLASAIDTSLRAAVYESRTLGPEWKDDSCDASAPHAGG